MFQWLNDILSALLRLIPRVTVVPTTHGGIAFVRGRPRLLRSGRLRVWWPLVTELLMVPVVRQTLNLPNQVLIPADQQRPYVVSGVVVYSIRDPVKALSGVHDLDDAVRDMALVAVKGVLTEHGLGAATDAALLKEVRSRMWGWGLDVQQVFLSDSAPCTVIRTVGNVAALPLIEEPSDE
jgi:hypothetical protein